MLPNLSADDFQQARATGTDGRAEPDSVLAFCLAREHSFSSAGMHSDALTEQGEGELSTNRKPRENTANCVIPGTKSEVHPRGLEPLTFGSVDRLLPPNRIFIGTEKPHLCDIPIVMAARQTGLSG